MQCILRSAIVVIAELFAISLCNASLSFVVEPPTWVTFTNTSGTSVECLASGSPKPIVEWIGLDHSLIRNIPGVREIWSNGTLSILPFGGTQYRQDVHAGIFQCRARNLNGVILAPPTTLRAVVVQDLEIRLYDEFVWSGNTAILRCIVPSFMSDLVAVTSWDRDGSFPIYPSVQGDGKHHALPDGRLLIFNVDVSDSYSNYRCRAAHRVTMADALSNSARIIVNEPQERSAPKMITKTESISFVKDASIIVPCIAHAHPSPKYRWYLSHKENLRQPLQIGSSRGSFSSHKELSRQEVLILPSQHEALRHVPADAKVLCEAYNDVGTATMEVLISRKESFSIEVSPKILTLDATSSGRFHCRFSTSVDRPSVSWYKNGQLLSSSGAITIRDSGTILEIHRADRHDAGMYQCFVRMQDRVHQSSAEMRLGASQPEFTYRFIQQTLTPGPAVSLKCIAGGSPTPTISWTLDGFPLPQSDRILMGQYVNMNGEVISHVNISRTHIEDGGEFSCTASNVAGSVTHSSPLYIYGPPYVRNIGSMTAVAGESYSIRCPVAGYPVPSVKWTKGGRELPVSRRHEASGPNLKIFKVNRDSDEGDYVCIASDRQGRTDSKTLSLRVVEPPKVAPFSLPEALSAGSRVAVQCLVLQGDPPVGIKWYHNHHLAQKTHGVTVTPLGRFVLALVIDKLAPVHAGNYTCKATSHSASSSDSHSSVLKVHVPPIIKSFDFGELIAGMRTQVTCLVQTGDPPIQITWLHNKLPLAPNADITIRQLDTFSSSLIFSSVNSHHVGNYTCVAANDAKEIRHTAPLLVRVAPHWTVEPRDMSVVKGSNAMISCLAGGFPEPAVTWRRTQKGNKQSFFHHAVSQNLIGAQTLKNGSLLLEKVSEAAEGAYLCEVSNGVGMDLSALAHLNVQVPPKVKGEDVIEVRKGDSVSIHCVASGDAPLTLSMARDRQPIDSANSRFSAKIQENSVKGKKDFAPENDREKHGELTLTSVMSSDSGEFTCTATNPYGSHTHVTKLIVQDVPEAPRNLRLANEGSRSTSVSWTPPQFHSTPVQHYVIYIKTSKEMWGSQNFQTVKVDGKATSADIQNLLPASDYQLRVAAINSVGESSPSEPLAIRTKGEPPSAPPQSVRAIPVSPTKIKLQWSSPDPENWHGNLIGYYIGYRKQEESNSQDYEFKKISIESEDELSWTVTGLHKFTRYEFVVQAFNSLGPGPLSRPVHAVTHEDVPEAAPTDFSCMSLTSRRLEISWLPPPKKLTHGKIASYTVMYSSVERFFSAPPKETHVMTGKSTILSDLKPFTNYSVTVAAVTKAGQGVESMPITCFTEEDIPDAPRRIKALVSDKTGIIVAWSPPQNENGFISKYTLYIQTQTARDTKRRMVPSQSRSYELSSLIEGEEYFVWMTASTRVGEGAPTRKVSIRTSITVPAGIRALDEKVRVAKGSDVLLQCPYVGDPIPKLSWTKGDSKIETISRWQRQPDGGLLLHDSRAENTGNYSCKVSNVYGSDMITFVLIVMVPPEQPILRLVDVTSNSITVNWSLGSDGGAAINTLKLTWRPDRSEWQEITLHRHSSTYELGHLSCGTSYHLYMTPHNEIGPGLASEMLSARTKGERPASPPQHQVIELNSTSASINLNSFNDTNCPVQFFYVKAKETASDNWIIANERIVDHQPEYTLKNLMPGTEYEVEIAATNSAGKTISRYSFRTFSLGGPGNNAMEIMKDEHWIKNGKDLLKDPAFIVPVILSCVAFVAILISVGICIRRKSTTASTINPTQKFNENKYSPRRDTYIPNESIYYPSMKKISTSPNRDVESINTAPEYAEDIYPYATFQLQQQNDGSTLQTLVFQDPRKASVHTVAYRKDTTERKSNNHGRSLSSGSDYAKVRRSRRGTSYGGVESEESYSDTDTDLTPSNRTESSSRIDGRNTHHNMLYLTSDASTIPSPPNERKIMTCQPSNIRIDDSANRIYGISAIRGDPNRLPVTQFKHSGGHKSPAISNSRKRKGSNDGLEYSETECDRESRRRISKQINYNNSFAV